MFAEQGPEAGQDERTAGVVDDDPEEEFREFTLSRWPRLLRTAYLLTGDHHDAEDLVQSTLAKVYAGWGRIRGSEDVDAYVHRSMINNNRSRFRRLRVAEVLTAWLPERPQADRAARLDDRDVLVRALAELPARQRAAVVLRYWEDLPEARVAQIMGSSVGAVKSQAFKGLAKLREDPGVAEFFTGPRQKTGARKPGEHEPEGSGVAG